MQKNNALMLITLSFLVSGCASFQQTPWSQKATAQEVALQADDLPEQKIEDNRDALTVVTDYISGRGRQDVASARSLYHEAEGLFNQAASLQGTERTRMFRKAATTFRKAAKQWDASALEEDALFMSGESYFFADDLPECDELYGKLLEQYPRSRHVDRVVARRFEIAKYWLAMDKQRSSFVPINITDHTLPALDIDRTGIKLLDQIRYDAPTGKLADDSTMACGLEYFERKRWILADGLFSDLRETFPDSDHQFNAHLFGLKCKLEIYQGPKYSGTVLEEAADLVEQMKRRFPADLEIEENREMVGKSAARIEHLRAERIYYSARFRELRSENKAAKFYYQQILDKYPTTSYAETARERMAELADSPDTPPKRLAWLTKIIPDGEPAKPIMVGSSKGILR